MKILLITILLMATLAGSVAAQNKFKPLIERIALLQVYLEYLQKGYGIARNGLESVRKITKGEFDLHGDFFNSLAVVNPEVKKYTRIASIISTQINMVKAYKEAYRYAKECNQFAEEEIDYLFRVFEQLLLESTKDIELLTTVITNHKIKMEDQQRIDWIDKVFTYIKDKEKFLLTFNAELYGLAKTRLNEQQDIKMLQKIYQP